MAKYKVVITARSFGKADDKAYDCLRKAGCEWVKLNEADGPIEEQLRDAIKDADALIAGLEDIDAETINRAEKLKVISRYGVGYDKVDLAAARQKGIQVTITPGANGDSVADLAVALMLDVARSVTIRTVQSKPAARKGPRAWKCLKRHWA